MVQSIRGKGKIEETGLLGKGLRTNDVRNVDGGVIYQLKGSKRHSSTRTPRVGERLGTVIEDVY